MDASELEGVWKFRGTGVMLELRSKNELIYSRGGVTEFGDYELRETKLYLRTPSLCKRFGPIGAEYAVLGIAPDAMGVLSSRYETTFTLAKVTTILGEMIPNAIVGRWRSDNPSMEIEFDPNGSFRYTHWSGDRLEGRYRVSFGKVMFQGLGSEKIIREHIAYECHMRDKNHLRLLDISSREFFRFSRLKSRS